MISHRNIGIGATLALFLVQSGAQVLRDPTTPPPEAAMSGANATPKLPAGLPTSTIIVRDGKPYLVVGTRLYAQGQTLGQARIERISETEVWLREGGVLRKVSQFPGIVRRAVKSTPLPSTPKAPND